jgi:hypothetical protein
LTKTAICGTATMPICHCMKLSGPLYPGQALLERAYTGFDRYQWRSGPSATSRGSTKASRRRRSNSVS